jgi:glycosyltransferase involved in cell wall biosynthesis
MQTRVSQVSLSEIASDPRIQRNIKALEQASYEVVAIGYGKGISQKQFNLKEKILTAFFQMPSSILPFSASFFYWLRSQNRLIYKLLLEQNPKIIHAHDWHVLPACVRAAKKLNAALIYDSHEFAREQLIHRKLWRLVYPNYITSLENRYVIKADKIVTISQGCGDLIEKACGLKTPVSIIRNVPSFQKHKYRPVNESDIIVQFIGFYTPGRGLENLIKSASLWPKNFKLRLTGWANDENYLLALKKLAKAQIGKNIEFHERVPYSKLLTHANSADIGIVFADNISAQFEISLPNKLFEYIMAGLMVCVGPGKEMHKLLAKHKIGIALNSNQPEELANCLASLTIDKINNYKKASLLAAKELNWENEQEKLLGIYSSLDRLENKTTIS